VAGSRFWNSLPVDVTSAQTLAAFRKSKNLPVLLILDNMDLLVAFIKLPGDDFIGMAANRLDYKQSTLLIAKEEKIIQKYPTTVSTS